MQDKFNKVYLKDTLNEKLFTAPQEYDYSRFLELDDFALDEDLKTNQKRLVNPEDVY